MGSEQQGAGEEEEEEGGGKSREGEPPLWWNDCLGELRVYEKCQIEKGGDEEFWPRHTTQHEKKTFFFS